MSTEARAFVYLAQPSDVYRVGRTLRSLATAGISAMEISTPSPDQLRTIFAEGTPVLFVRAGAWLINTANCHLPLPSATGKALCAVGAIKAPSASDSARTQSAADWNELFVKTGGDFSRSSFPVLPPPFSLSLDSLAARRLAEAKASSFDEVLRLAAAEFRFIHYGPLDVYEDQGLRVVQVITSLQRGGAERMTLDLVAELPGLNTRVCLATLGRAARESFLTPAGTVELAGLARDPEVRCAELCRNALAFGADVVHGHLLTRSDARVISSAGLPLILTVHNTQPGWPIGLADLADGDATLLAACARTVETELRQAGVSVPIRTVRNGIALRKFQPTPERLAAGCRWRQTWGFGENDFVLVAVANPRPQKRLHLLPAVLAALRARTGGREARLVFVGEVLRGNPDSERSLAETLAEIARLDLEPHVRWTGSVAEVAEILAAADALVSTSAHEGLSLAQLEALAMGCSVVATDVGGAREIAAEVSRFHLVPPDASAEEFAEVLAGLAQGSNGPLSLPAATARQRGESEGERESGAGIGNALQPHPLAHSPSDGEGARMLNWSRQRMAARYKWLYPRAIAAMRRRGTGEGIWLLTNNFSTGGAQASARRLLVGLHREGVRVRAAVVEEDSAWPTPGTRALIEAGVRVIAPPLDPSGHHDAAIEQILAALDTDPPQSVLFWNLRPAFKVALADALLNVPVFDISPGEMFYESLEKFFEKPQARWGCRTPLEYGALLAGVIVKYRAEARQAKQYLGVPVHVVPNGVPLSGVRPSSAAAGSGRVETIVPRETARVADIAAPEDGRTPPNIYLEGRAGVRFVFGTAARINPQKRLEDLLEAFHLAHGRLPPYTLKVAGGIERGCADYAEGLRTAGEGLPIEWLGETADVAKYHQDLDAFVMISEPAGCPNASLEALAAGLPVIATDAGGASEQVIDGQTGRLVPARDPHALAAALIELATRADLRRLIASGGSQHMRERFSLDRMIADYRRICLPMPAQKFLAKQFRTA